MVAMKITRWRLQIVSIFVIVMLILFSCSKDSILGNDQKQVVHITLLDQEKEEVHNNYGSISTLSKIKAVNEEPLRTNGTDIKLDDDYYISAEVVLESSKAHKIERLKSNNYKVAGIIKEPIKRNIRFRLIVYDQEGNYSNDIIYEISSAGTVVPIGGEELMLDRGIYYFVAYSYNKWDIPTEDLTDSDINHNIIVSTDKYPQFMMYTSGLKKIGPKEDNSLNISFKYKFSPINLTIDATAANGYLISSIGEAKLSSTYKETYISFSSGDVSHHGEEENRLFTFEEYNRDKLSSNTLWVANNTNSGSIEINSLQVGPINWVLPIKIDNIKILSGVGYKITLRIKPTDRFETINGQAAALINGRYWMRGNLGVTSDVFDDPDPSGSFQHLIGNYYQWGKSEIRATAYTVGAAPESNEWNVIAPDGSWYSATDNGGKVIGKDPCPDGWRVPTSQEFLDLIEATTQSLADNRGTNWNPSEFNFSTAKTFRSKKNSGVILTFPSSGYFNPTSRTIASRGSHGYYWSSTESSDRRSALRMTTYSNRGDEGASVASGSVNRVYAWPVRCTQSVF